MTRICKYVVPFYSTAVMCMIIIALLVLIAEGKEVPSFKIIGGNVASASQLPEVVAFLTCQSSNSSGGLSCYKLCSGTLIAPNVVMTAAHCVRSEFSAFDDLQPSSPVSNMYAVAGTKDYQQSDWSSDGMLLKVIKVVFGAYGTNVRFQTDGDIALLELETCLSPMIGSVEFAKVGTRDNEPSASCDDVTVAGYGKITNAPDPLSVSDGKLRYFTTNLNSPETCLDVSLYLSTKTSPPYNYNLFSPDVRYSIIDDLYLCSGGNSIDSVCFGDSGGPTLYNGAVIGVTSFGIGGSGEFCFIGPGYSTRVAYYATWIRDQMENRFSTCSGWRVSDSFPASSWPLTQWTPSVDFSASRCPSQLWQCLSGECIEPRKVCDGTPNCWDGSDETFVSNAGVSLCPSNSFSGRSSGPGLRSTGGPVDCVVAINQVQAAQVQVETSENVIGDIYWDPSGVVSACTVFNSCFNLTTSNPPNYGTSLSFCNSLTEFLNFNKTRSDFIQDFYSLFDEPLCSTDTSSTTTSTRDASSTTVTSSSVKTTTSSTTTRKTSTTISQTRTTTRNASLTSSTTTREITVGIKSRDTSISFLQPWYAIIMLVLIPN
jgi:trypsin